MIKVFASNKILKKFGQQFIETFCYMLVRFFKPTGHHSLGFCALCEPLVHFALKKTKTKTHRMIACFFESDLLHQSSVPLMKISAKNHNCVKLHNIMGTNSNMKHYNTTTLTKMTLKKPKFHK
jgi:hypothetical protein